jgi:protein-tyrosine phosphatase
MIDVHCHLLPQIDDGPDSAESSLRQMKIMADGGIKDVFCTAHYMPGTHSFDTNVYDRKLLEMQLLAKENDLGIKLHRGFEVFLHPNSLDEIQKNNLVMGSSKYVLIESDLNGLSADFYNQVYPLLRKGYKPILAHAERYVSIMKKPREAKDLISKDIYIQINSGSLLGHYGEKVRQTAWVLLRNGWAHLFGSDDHVHSPYESYFKALELLKADLDKEVVGLLSEEFPRMVLDNKRIPFKYVYIWRPRHQHRQKRSFWHRLLG